MRREADEATDGEKLMEKKFDAEGKAGEKSACGSVLGRYCADGKLLWKNFLKFQVLWSELQAPPTDCYSLGKFFDAL